MIKVTRELKTGIIAILTIIAFIWGFNFLKGKNLFDNSKVFYVEYNNVQGLSMSAPVTINGLKVGNVTNITFHPTKKETLVVAFSLNKDYSFSKNSSAEIYAPDFISGKSIKINPVFTGTTAVSGDTLPGLIEEGILGALNEQIAPLQTKVESFLINADMLLQGINKVFDVNTQANLKEAIASLNSTLSTFRISAKSLDTMLADGGQVDSVLTNATVASHNLVKLTDSLNNANLKQTINKLENTVEGFNTILANIKSGKGTIGKLLEDEKLYNNLEGAAKDLEELLTDLKLNPKRYVHFSLFGKRPKPYSSENVKEE
ncbi:MAG: ABC transporter substrate-binding protein [Flavobacteriales bacterium]|nr:MAG: ABC transporter substrate-binding protein [Flavobacteriales bacterium]